MPKSTAVAVKSKPKSSKKKPSNLSIIKEEADSASRVTNEKKSASKGKAEKPAAPVTPEVEVITPKFKTMSEDITKLKTYT